MVLPYFAVILGVLGQIQDEEGIPLFVCAPSESSTLDSFDENSALDEHLKKSGVSFSVHTKGKFRIIVSEKVAPIRQLKEALKLTSTLLSSSEFIFSPNSTQGKILLDELGRRSDVADGLDRNSTSKSVGLSAALSITDPSGKLATTFHPLNQNLKLDPATQESISDEERERRRALRKRAPSFNPLSFAMYEYRIHSFGISPRQKIQDEFLVSTSAVLQELGLEMAKLKAELNETTDRLEDKLIAETFGANVRRGNAQFNELDPKVQEMLMTRAKSNPAMFGFRTGAEVEQYLNSNPKLTVNLNLTISLKTMSDSGSSSQVNIMIIND